MATFYLRKSDKPEKKWVAVFLNPTTGREKRVYFGAAGMSDYTIHKDPERKQRYINRHQKREYWNDPATAGFWSRWILWNKPSLAASISDTMKKFKIKIVKKA